MHGIRVLMAKNYIDNLSEEVKKGLTTKASQGLYPSFAPLGYLNLVHQGKRVIAPDPERSPLVSNLFDWFASGEYSLKALAAKASASGFRFRNTQNKIPVSTLHKILRNRIYTGVFEYGGKRYQGTHQPLVSRATWERCQEILDDRRETKHRSMKNEFAFSGLLRCGHCGCAIVGELKKGRYVYYHCTGYRGKCPEPYTREEVLTRVFTERLGDLRFGSEIVRWLQSQAIDHSRNAKDRSEQSLQRLHHDLDRLRNRLDTLYEDRLDGRIAGDTYDRKAAEVTLCRERVQKMLEVNRTELPSAGKADLRTAVTKLKELFILQSASHQRKLLRVLVREGYWQNQSLRVSFHSPFEELHSASAAVTGAGAEFVASGAQTEHGDEDNVEEQ